VNNCPSIAAVFRISPLVWLVVVRGMGLLMGVVGVVGVIDQLTALLLLDRLLLGGCC